MAVPHDQVVAYINAAISVAILRVNERAEELFTSEIASSGNGTASPFQKLLFPEARIFSSFERSLSASLGKAFDYIGAAIAKATYGNGEHDYKRSGMISSEVLAQIESIVRSYRARGGKPPDTTQELIEIRLTMQGSVPTLQREIKSDVFFVDHEGIENYLEIKTAMPNYDQGAAIKTRILTIHAMCEQAGRPARALVVFPHNPNGLIGEYAWPPTRYFLDPRCDWFAKGRKLMGPGLWNFIGDSDDTYEELMDCFYEVSLARRSQLFELLKITQGATSI